MKIGLKTKKKQKLKHKWSNVDTVYIDASRTLSGKEVDVLLWPSTLFRGFAQT